MPRFSAIVCHSQSIICKQARSTYCEARSHVFTTLRVLIKIRITVRLGKEYLRVLNRRALHARWTHKHIQLVFSPRCPGAKAASHLFSVADIEFGCVGPCCPIHGHVAPSWARFNAILQGSSSSYSSFTLTASCIL